MEYGFYPYLNYTVLFYSSFDSKDARCLNGYLLDENYDKVAFENSSIHGIDDYVVSALKCEVFSKKRIFSYWRFFVSYIYSGSGSMRFYIYSKENYGYYVLRSENSLELYYFNKELSINESLFSYDMQNTFSLEKLIVEYNRYGKRVVIINNQSFWVNMSYFIPIDYIGFQLEYSDGNYIDEVLLTTK